MLLRSLHDGETYRAGQLVPPGRYLRVGSYPSVEVVLDRPDVLPASLDGHVAEYQRIELAGLVAAGSR